MPILICLSSYAQPPMPSLLCLAPSPVALAVTLTLFVDSKFWYRARVALEDETDEQAPRHLLSS